MTRKPRDPGRTRARARRSSGFALSGGISTSRSRRRNRRRDRGTLTRRKWRKEAPTFAVREVLNGFIERVVGDMETKQVEVTLALPAWAFNENGDSQPMRLVGRSPSSTSYETHQKTTIVLAVADCEYVKGQRSICYKCRRRKAA